MGRRRSEDEAGAVPSDGSVCRLHGADRPPRRPGARRARPISKILDETVVYLIVGDNGASAEGSLQGTFNEMVTLGGFGHLETAESLMPRIDEFGAPRRTTTTRSAGRTRWTRLISGPNRWRRTGAAHATARSCTGRKGIKGKGEIRTQFHHVIDVAPTVLEAARPAAAADGQRRRRSSRSKASAWCIPSTMPARASAMKRSTSRCSATAASITRAGRR